MTTHRTDDPLDALREALNHLHTIAVSETGARFETVRIYASPLAVEFCTATSRPYAVPPTPAVADSLAAFLSDGAAQLTDPVRRRIGRLLASGLPIVVLLHLHFGTAVAVLVPPDEHAPITLFSAMPGPAQVH